ETAANLADTALLDKVVESNLIDEAVAFAKELVKNQAECKRVRDLEVKAAGDAQEILQIAEDKIQAKNKFLKAPLVNLKTVRASVEKPFDEGMAYERELFVGLMGSPESQAMRHIFAAEREALKIPDIPKDIPLRDI